MGQVLYAAERLSVRWVDESIAVGVPRAVRGSGEGLGVLIGPGADILVLLMRKPNS
jgi:hypothetical protein